MKRLFGSSTFWTGLVGFGVYVGSAAAGFPIPWEAVATWIGAFGIKEAARRRAGAQ